MTRGSLKFDWSVYSARRKVTIKLLVDKGVVHNYESYVSYCDEMSVLPMSKSSFIAEMSLIEPPAPNPPTPSALSPSEGPSSEQPGLVATVWFAGVKDDASLDSPPKSSKKKKEPPPQEPKA